MTSLIEALEAGDDRTLFVAMRDKIAETIDEGPSKCPLSSLRQPCCAYTHVCNL